MDWPNRHYRYFMRQISAQARVYAEMITADALLHGDVDRHLASAKDGSPSRCRCPGL